MKSRRLKKVKSAPFHLSMLDAPEKNLFPNLSKRIDISEFLDSKGRFLLPNLDQSLNEKEAEDESLSIQSINRVVKISKDFALFNYTITPIESEYSITKSIDDREVQALLGQRPPQNESEYISLNTYSHSC